MSHNEGKIFNDSVHGTIRLHSFLVRIIDTAEFQRLRNIKQMGGGYFVFPGAQHNRFEHSIGTAYLAGKLVRHLRELQSELDINEKDVLCVEIAGLCHDLGHGPFSHMFDGKFLKRFPSQSDTSAITWTHEQGSCDMFDRIIQKISDDIDKYNDRCISNDLKLQTNDFTFIKEMIKGPPAQSNSNQSGFWPYTGRDESKSFLYEIVSNKSSGVDVDKWDYFARDCHHLGITTGFDHNRFIKCTKVIEVEEDNGRTRKHICVRDKEIFDLYEMFHTRFVLHKRACQHPVVNAVELMICDALMAANDHMEIFDDKGNRCKISESMNNMSFFCKLDDRVLSTIQASTKQELKISQKLLKRLEDRDLYKCIGSKILGQKASRLSEAKIFEEIRGHFQGSLPSEKHLKVTVATFSYGKGKKNPIQNFWFFSKDNPEKAFHIPKEQVSSFLPDVFEERCVQVFWTSKEGLEKAKAAFENWYTKPEPSVIALLRDTQERAVNLEQKMTVLNKEMTDMGGKIARLEEAMIRKATSDQ